MKSELITVVKYLKASRSRSAMVANASLLMALKSFVVGWVIVLVEIMLLQAMGAQNIIQINC